MYCPKCGKENDNNAFKCVACGEIIQPPMQAPQPVRSIEDDPAMRAILPVGQSGLAVLAGYLGLFSLILIPGPFAILVSILAMRDIKRNPKKHGMYRAWIGLVMGVFGTIGLIAIAITVATGK